MRSERENETINKAGGRGSRRAERQRQNPKREIDAAGALTAAGTCEGAKAAAEVAQRAATASFMVKLFWGDINQRVDRRAAKDQHSAGEKEANGSGSRAGGRPPVHIRHHVDWLQERWSCSYKLVHAECLHTLIAYRVRAGLASMLFAIIKNEVVRTIRAKYRYHEYS